MLKKLGLLINSGKELFLSAKQGCASHKLCLVLMFEGGKEKKKANSDQIGPFFLSFTEVVSLSAASVGILGGL